MYKKLVFLLAVIVIISFASVCSAAGSVMDSEVITVGTESTFKPFEFRNEDNDLVGLDMELVEMIGEKLGKKVEIVDMSFDALIPSILTKKIDLVAAGMNATPERSKKVAFSRGYYSTPDAIIIKSGNEEISEVSDLGGKTASVQLGTIQDEFVTGIDGVTVKRFGKTDDALRELLLGRADFAVVDSTVAKDNLPGNKSFIGELKIAFMYNISETGMALAMNKEDPEFIKAVDEALGELIEDGSLEMLKDKWNVE